MFQFFFSKQILSTYFGSNFKCLNTELTSGYLHCEYAINKTSHLFAKFRAKKLSQNMSYCKEKDYSANLTIICSLKNNQHLERNSEAHVYSHTAMNDDHNLLLSVKYMVILDKKYRLSQVQNKLQDWNHLNISSIMLFVIFWRMPSYLKAKEVVESYVQAYCEHTIIVCSM